jgi:hypothetical protein
LKNVYRMFDDENCFGLRNKPKFFLIQVRH